MSAPIDILKRELEDQNDKLTALRDEKAADIERGRRAQAEVDAQTRHVNEIQNAINQLKRGEHKYPVAA